jgi:hypothetical protein
MLSILDMKTDNSDDIIINGDIEFENDTLLSTIKTAERRITARYDDFQLSNISAGLESHVWHRINESTKYAISEDIKRALTLNGLIGLNEYKTILLDELADGSMPIIIKFTSPYISSNYSFSTIVNQQNQRSYN